MSEQFDKLNHWYGWNGGERPVHGNTIVDTVDVDGGTWRGEASGADWSHDNRHNDIAAFRITKLYAEPKKPREWWVTDSSDGVLRIHARSADALMASGEPMLVREVLPEDEA